MPESPVPLVRALHAIAPLRLAGEWDNVGLLIEGDRPARSALLCVDLTEAVFAEAVERDVDWIVSYHPPIFKGLQRLTDQTPQGRVLLEAIRRRVTIYSPHTALDAARDGMCDWLMGAFGQAIAEASPIEPDREDPSVGAGRRGTLAAPSTVGEAVAAIKRHLGLAHVRVAAPAGAEAAVRAVAVCPGAGESLLASLRGLDLVLTGEMRHHSVLSLAARGTAVVLTDHTNTERGYLPRLAERLQEAVPSLQVACSTVDADPLAVW